MKTLYIVLLAVIAAGVIGLVACSDALSTDGEVNPLATLEDMVYGHVYEGGTHNPAEGAPVMVYKRESEEDDWIYIDGIGTDEYGFYEFHIDWPAGWYGQVDCTNDLETGFNEFSPYPQQGPVEADIYLE